MAVQFCNLPFLEIREQSLNISPDDRWLHSINLYGSYLNWPEKYKNNKKQRNCYVFFGNSKGALYWCNEHLPAQNILPLYRLSQGPAPKVMAWGKRLW